MKASNLIRINRFYRYLLWRRRVALLLELCAVQVAQRRVDSPPAVMGLDVLERALLASFRVLRPLLFAALA